VTPRQRHIFTALSRVSPQLGSASKRFIRDHVEAALKDPSISSSPRQIAYALRLCHRYRRQIPARVLGQVLDEIDDLFELHPEAFGPKGTKAKMRGDIIFKSGVTQLTLSI
jgi:hypothetical protein